MTFVQSDISELLSEPKRLAGISGLEISQIPAGFSSALESRENTEFRTELSDHFKETEDLSATCEANYSLTSPPAAGRLRLEMRGDGVVATGLRCVRKTCCASTRSLLSTHFNNPASV